MNLALIIKEVFKAEDTFNKLRAGINLYGETASKKLEGTAKSKAPWTDRTGNARNSIQGRFYWEGKSPTIELSGNVDYFVYLELAHEKRNAVLVPTMESEGPSVLEGYKNIFK